MATSRGLDQFSRRMRVVAEKISGNADKSVRRAALAADQAVVLATPVDTGRARANWITSIGNPSTRTTDSVDPSGGSSIAQGAGVIATYQKGQGSIFITNSLDYIGFLEEGSSRQAPRGMTRFAIDAAQAQLGKARLLEGIR